MATNKLGIACLIVAISLIFLIDARVLLVLGFLYYSYKLLYKKEKLSRLDKILIVSLFVLLLLEIILIIYYTGTLVSSA